MYSTLKNLFWKSSEEIDDISSFENIHTSRENVEYIDYISHFYDISDKYPLKTIVIENHSNDYYSKSDYDSYTYTRTLSSEQENYVIQSSSEKEYAYPEYSQPSYVYT